MISPTDRTSRVQQVYTDLNRKFEEQETQAKALTQKAAYINLYGFPVDTQALNLLTKQQAETFGCVAFYKDGHGLKLGVLELNEGANQITRSLTEQGYKVDLFIISKSSFHQAIEEYSKILKPSQHFDTIKLKSRDLRFSLQALKALVPSQNPATESIEQIIGTALELDASDIHIEPEKNDLKIRLRVDGVLQEVASMAKNLHQQLISRIKILSKTKLNVTNTPQDGSFSLTFDANPVDIRVSVLPSAFGESIVMRLLRQDKGALKFEELGIEGLAKGRILKEMEKPNGLILTTGPTGSGKTTTLYAILNKLNEPGVKIITIEDPVEYKIEGITQTPIDARTGMTFAAVLRAILRQDPDIVMVGEMRDLETAEIACQAALTGHIVLSTLHTNDAAGALPRLMDLGVRSFVLGPAINVIIAQRLVRKLCPDCKQAYKLPDNLQARVEMILKSIPKEAKADIPKILVFYHSIGCDKCHNMGYKGRIGVYEVFTVSEEIEKLIQKQATTSEIKRQAVSEGMLTMAQDGILKALQGITDVEEVFRVTEE